MSMQSFLVTSEMLKKRLDRILTEAFPGKSRTYFQYLIGAGLVLVNGERVKKRECLEMGDEIEICFELTPEMSLEAENIALEILYEDEHLLAVNKPAGMVVHPAPGHPSGTFVNALLYHCKTLPENSLRPGIVHRLDKETSGVLLAAKTSQAHQLLVEIFSSRKICKRYLALCVGNPGTCTIDAPLKRHPIKRQEMHVDSTGKPAISICTPLEMRGDLTWVEIQLITGRTHQIRAHLKHRGTPIVGDPVYGLTSQNKKLKAERQMLHAFSISLNHPITDQVLHIIAPFPADIQSFSPPLHLQYPSR